MMEIIFVCCLVIIFNKSYILSDTKSERHVIHKYANNVMKYNSQEQDSKHRIQNYIIRGGGAYFFTSTTVWFLIFETYSFEGE